MNKYLVDIYLPSISHHYNVYLPCNKNLGEVIGLLIKILESLSGNSFKGTLHSVLIDAESGHIYNTDLTVSDAGIRNASKLIFI